MQELPLDSISLRLDEVKYIVTFSTRIRGEDHWFSIALPVQTSDVACVRWCAVVTILEVKKPRSHPVTILKIPEAMIKIGDKRRAASYDNDVLDFPSEWSPSRGSVPSGLANTRDGVNRIQKVKNLVVSVPRTYNVQVPGASRNYFHCSYEPVADEVVDLTGAEVIDLSNMHEE
jgi:hypothetical protein